MTVTLAPSVCGPGDRPELWQGAVAWTRDGDWWQGWRLLPEELRWAYASGLNERARSGAGIRFVADVVAERLDAMVEGSPEAAKAVDVLVDGELVLRQAAIGATTVTVDLPAGEHRVELWLPHFAPVRVGRVHLHGASNVSPIAPRTRWLAYGSSITESAASPGPSETWPALVARTLEWDLACLGFGGQCHLDPAAERTIVAHEVDVIFLSLGINIYGSGSFNQRSLPGQIAEFIRTVRTAHPRVPLLVMSPIIAPDREDMAKGAGMPLSQVRDLVETVITDLRAGDPLLSLVSGPDVFGVGDVDLLTDGLHPSGAGYRLMAERLAPLLAATQHHTDHQ